MKLQEWISENQPKEEMIWKDSFWTQVKFVRDRLINAFDIKSSDEYSSFRESVEVISIHTSKSISLPVYRIVWKGITLTLRNNFYNWKLSIESDKPLHNLNQFELFRSSDRVVAVCCKGFKDDWIFQPYEESNQKFSLAINNDYELFFLIKLIYSKFSE